MTEIPQNPEQTRPHLEDPELVAGSIETLVEHLATPESIQTGVNWMLNRQEELYSKHRAARDNGERIPKTEETELDEIHTALMEVGHIIEKYHPGE